MEDRENKAKKDLSLSVTIPAYNEAARLPRTLHAAVEYLEKRGLPYEILTVDDGSRDQTAEVIRQTACELAPMMTWGTIEPLGYDRNRGKGYAVRYGILRSSGNHVLFMDADLATPMEELEKLEAALRPEFRIEVAIGSRPLRESQLVVRQPLLREVAGRAFNKAVQLLATRGIADTQCGFKLFTHSAAREIFSRCTLDGFSFDVEALFLARRLGYDIAEVPVRWAHQEGAAAFATRGAYLRAGIKMLRDLIKIRQTHRSVRPLSPTVIVPGRTIPPA